MGITIGEGVVVLESIKALVWWIFIGFWERENTHGIVGSGFIYGSSAIAAEVVPGDRHVLSGANGAIEVEVSVLGVKYVGLEGINRSTHGAEVVVIDRLGSATALRYSSPFLSSNFERVTLTNSSAVEANPECCGIT